MNHAATLAEMIERSRDLADLTDAEIVAYLAGLRALDVPTLRSAAAAVGIRSVSRTVILATVKGRLYATRLAVAENEV